jgi:ribonuclease BN (tRNA processing enzyme)
MRAPQFPVEAGGRRLVFATDVEHAGRIDPALTRLAEGADLLVHDAQYTPDEYHGGPGPGRVGWGHSTWVEAVQAAEIADVAQLALTHHDPQRTDDAVAVLEARARERFPAAFAAREGVQISL